MVVEVGGGTELTWSPSPTLTSRVFLNSKFPGLVKTELDFQIETHLEGDGNTLIVQVNFSSRVNASLCQMLAGGEAFPSRNAGGRNVRKSIPRPALLVGLVFCPGGRGGLSALARIQPQGPKVCGPPPAQTLLHARASETRGAGCCGPTSTRTITSTTETSNTQQGPSIDDSDWLFLNLYIYFRERKRENEHWGGEEGERERERSRVPTEQEVRCGARSHPLRWTAV